METPTKGKRGGARPGAGRKPRPKAAKPSAFTKDVVDQHEATLIAAHYEALVAVSRELVRRLETDPSTFTTRQLVQTAERLAYELNRRTRLELTRRQWDVVRFAVLERDGFACRYCGRTPLQHGVTLVVDHVYPRDRGGPDTPDNLITACSDCNAGKADYVLTGVGASAVRDYLAPSKLD